MGILSDFILAPPDAANDILASDNPTASWDGFSFKGADNIKIATLLSLLSSQSHDADYEKWLAAIPCVVDSENGPWVFAFPENAVKSLSTIAAMDEDEFEQLAKRWGATDEFRGWHPEDVNDLLREIGDLAETATLEQKSMFLWMSL